MVTITDCDKVLVGSDDCLTRVALLNKNRVNHLFFESSRNVSNVGNIYKGRITRVLKGLRAAFVDIGEGKNGFLPFEEAEEMYVNEDMDEGEPPVPMQPPSYRVGEELLLQVTKPATGMKGPKLTTHVSVPGRLLVLLPLTPRRGVSRRIEDHKERRRLLKIMDDGVPKTMGFILRTACEKQPAEQILSEVKHLRQVWSRIHRETQKVRAPRLLWKEAELPEQVVRDMVGDEAREIWVDNERHYRSLRQYAKTFVPELLQRIKLYRERVPIFVKHDVERQFEQFLENKVPLPSGGSLIFEESETLVAIDVNTGGTERKSLDETIFHVNMEAAREIPRQIRIRNLSGLLIIDFIDMRNESQRKEVFRTLDRNLEEDKARLKIFSISKLGLVEMSREKFGLSLQQLLTTPCERCAGNGVVPSAELCAIRIKNAILEKLAAEPGKHFAVTLSETVHNFIRDQRILKLGFLESRRIVFKPRTDRRDEDFEVTEERRGLRLLPFVGRREQPPPEKPAREEPRTAEAEPAAGREPRARFRRPERRRRDQGGGDARGGEQRNDRGGSGETADRRNQQQDQQQDRQQHRQPQQQQHQAQQQGQRQQQRQPQQQTQHQEHPHQQRRPEEADGRPPEDADTAGPARERPDGQQQPQADGTARRRRRRRPRGRRRRPRNPQNASGTAAPSADGGGAPPAAEPPAGTP